jgi:hypothetical protein
LGHGCASACFCVVLSCVGTGLASGCSPVQGVLPNVSICRSRSLLGQAKGPRRTVSAFLKQNKNLKSYKRNLCGKTVTQWIHLPDHALRHWRWRQHGLRNVGFQPPHTTRRHNPENNFYTESSENLRL